MISRETPEGLAARLGARFGLADDAVVQLGALLALLGDDPNAPTTVTALTRAADVHLADSLVALELEEVSGARRVADLGSGPGFPGLALAAGLPHARVWLIESSKRKCAFLGRAVERSGIANAEVVCRRAEEWHAGAGRCDLVTARALAPLAVVAEYAAPLLDEGGCLVAWKGARDSAEEAAAAAAASILGLEPASPVPVVPYPDSRDRWLHRYRKVSATPARFPRRPGMARKRPLGATSADSSRTARTLRRQPR